VTGSADDGSAGNAATDRSARLFWTFSVLMLAIATAIFFGAFLSPPYGLLPLLASGASAYTAWSLRKLNKTLKAMPIRRDPLSLDYRRIHLETFFILAIFLPALFSGASTSILLAVLVGSIAVVCAVEVRMVRNRLRHRQTPRVGR
jgi:hypothetical protein